MDIETTARLDDWGPSLPVSAREAFLLSGQDCAWYVRTGEVHLFLDQRRDDQLKSGRIPLFSVRQGELLVGFPTPSADETWMMAGVGAIDTTLVRIPLDAFFTDSEPLRTGGGQLLAQWLDRLRDAENKDGQPLPDRKSVV